LGDDWGKGASRQKKWKGEEEMKSERKWKDQHEGQKGKKKRENKKHKSRDDFRKKGMILHQKKKN